MDWELEQRNSLEDMIIVPNKLKHYKENELGNDILQEKLSVIESYDEDDDRSVNASVLCAQARAQILKT